ncbi:MAG TPA: sigma-70 family RNA polymerase sigma factor [Pricia sp.]|nr:sigma-70 family RNA polymerase sigma factor [Pricia sp.]
MEISKDYQTKLFPYAYNILGTTDDAKDVVQDVIMGHVERNGENIENEASYLVKSVINKSINLKKRNMKMVGDTTWLPEPVSIESADADIKSHEIISYSVLVLLEHLNPKERAVFILKEVFDYSHQEIADIFSISVENSRKLLSRAKNVLREKNSDFGVHSAHETGFLHNYIDVIKSGDVETLEKMLSDQITAKTDGGGKVTVVSELTSGVEAVAQFAMKVYNMYLKNYTVKFKNLNHEPVLLFYKGSRLVSCQIFDLAGEDGKIRNMYSVVDPAKLRKIEKK